MKNQTVKEKQNQFRCAVCHEWRLRGMNVKVEAGFFSGCVVKTCATQGCIEKAKKGELPGSQAS